MSESNQTLAKTTIRGIFWGGIERFSVQIVQFICGIVVARILSPDDYGLIGMLTIFLAVAQLFIDGGFSMALIQKQNRTNRDYSTVFVFSIIISVVLYLLFYLSTPFIARFYGVMELKELARVMFIVLIINSLSIVQYTQLRINVNFKVIAKINFIATLLSGILSIYAAYAGAGVWALVIQAITRSLVATICFWLFVKWVPILYFSYSTFRQLFGFGSKILISGMVTVLVNNIYTLVIGKYYQAKELGYYTRACSLTDLASGTIDSVLQTVSYPILTSLQNEREQMINYFKKLSVMTMLFVIPLMVMFACLARPLVIILLTDKWLPAVPYISWLAFASLFTPLSMLNLNMLNAIGRSDLYLRLDFIKIPVVVIMMIITFPIGVKAVVIGRVVQTFICFGINTYWSGKLFHFGLLSQIRASLKIVLASFIMAIVISGITFYIDSNILQLILGIGIGIGIYLLILYLLKEKSFVSIRNNIMSR